MMKKAWLAAIIPGFAVLAAAVFVLALFLVKALWAWTIPDLFPGAVSEGLIADEISWYTSFKVALLVAVLAGTARGTQGKS